MDSCLVLSPPGTYIYIETSFPRKEGEKANLLSGFFQPKVYCMQFWYHMFGGDMGTLNILTRPNPLGQPVFTDTNDNGKVWRNATAQIPDVKQSFEIIIQGIVGKSHKGDIAVDDIVITEGECKGTGWKRKASSQCSLVCGFFCQINTHLDSRRSIYILFSHQSSAQKSILQCVISV